MGIVERLNILQTKLEEPKNDLERANEEIKRLKEEYIMLQNASDEVEEEKDKEIERLNNNWKVAVEDLSRIAELLDLEEGCTICDIEDKIKRLNNKLSLIKGIIRTPRALDKSLAYAMVKTQIENVLGSDKE